MGLYGKTKNAPSPFRVQLRVRESRYIEDVIEEKDWGGAMVDGKLDALNALESMDMRSIRDERTSKHSMTPDERVKMCLFVNPSSGGTDAQRLLELSVPNPYNWT